MPHLPASRRTGILLEALVGVAGFLLVAYATSRFGPALTTVSGDFFSAARGLLDGQGFIEHNGNPFLFYMPVYPTLLAAAGLLGAGFAAAARFINAAAFGAIAVVAACRLYATVSRRVLAVLGAAAVVLSAPLLSVAVGALSEPVYTLCVLLFIVSLERFLAEPRQRRLVAAGVFAALAALTRLIGMSTIAAGAVAIAAMHPDRRRWRDTGLFVALSGIPLAAWHVRNLVFHSRLAGDVGASSTTLVENTRFALSAIANWFLPGVVPGPARIVFAAMLAAVLVAVALVRSSRSLRVRLIPILLLCGAHTAMQIIASTIRGLDPLGNRFMVPIFVPLWIAAVTALDHLLDAVPRPRRRALAVAAAAMLALFVIDSGRRSLRNARYDAAHGAGGYATTAWQRSATVAALSTIPDDVAVFSNESCVVYIFTGIRARESPRRHYFNSNTPVDDPLEELRSRIDGKHPVYLVWFDRVHRDYLFSPEDLSRSLRLEPVVREDDGTVYRVWPRPHG